MSCLSATLTDAVFVYFYLCICKSDTLHYKLSSIKRGQFRFSNFDSHFIRVKIFQIDFALILSAYKYFRWIYLSFYLHPNISDRFPFHFIFVEDKMNTWHYTVAVFYWAFESNEGYMKL